jgi:hypothetical protein
MYYRETGKFDCVCEPGFELAGEFSRVDDDLWEKNLRSARWIRKPHFLVNGDDVCGVSNPTHYQYWQEAIRMASFKFSVGKNFLSKEFVTVNTEMYIPREVETEMGYKHTFVPYINGALLFPEWAHLRINSKLEAIEGTNRCMSLGDMSFDLTRGFDLEQSDKLVGAFLEEWSEYINVLPGFVPLFVPRSDGGLGLRQTRQRPLSVQQKKWVAWHRLARTRELEIDPWDQMCIKDAFDGRQSIWDTVRTTHMYSVKPVGQRETILMHRDDASPPSNESSFLGYLFESYDVMDSVVGLKELDDTMRHEYQRAQGAVNRKNVKSLRTGNWSNYDPYKLFSYYTSEVNMETHTSVESVLGALRTPETDACYDHQGHIIVAPVDWLD